MTTQLRNDTPIRFDTKPIELDKDVFNSITENQNKQLTNIAGIKDTYPDLAKLEIIIPIHIGPNVTPAEYIDFNNMEMHHYNKTSQGPVQSVSNGPITAKVNQSHLHDATISSTNKNINPITVKNKNKKNEPTIVDKAKLTRVKRQAVYNSNKHDEADDETRINNVPPPTTTQPTTSVSTNPTKSITGDPTIAFEKEEEKKEDSETSSVHSSDAEYEGVDVDSVSSPIPNSDDDYEDVDKNRGGAIFDINKIVNNIITELSKKRVQEFNGIIIATFTHDDITTNLLRLPISDAEFTQGLKNAIARKHQYLLHTTEFSFIQLKNVLKTEIPENKFTQIIRYYLMISEDNQLKKINENPNFIQKIHSEDEIYSNLFTNTRNTDVDVRRTYPYTLDTLINYITFVSAVLQINPAETTGILDKLTTRDIHMFDVYVDKYHETKTNCLQIVADLLSNLIKASQLSKKSQLSQLSKHIKRTPSFTLTFNNITYIFNYLTETSTEDERTVNNAIANNMKIVIQNDLKHIFEATSNTETILLQFNPEHNPYIYSGISTPGTQFVFTL